MSRMSRAQSNSTDPGRNLARSSKKLDSTRSTAMGSTRHREHRSSIPSYSFALVVAEYPTEPRSKNDDAPSSEPKTEPPGSSAASRPSTRR